MPVRIEPWAERRSGSGFSSCRVRACSTSPGPGRCSATPTTCSAALPMSSRRWGRARRPSRRATASSWVGPAAAALRMRACRTWRSSRARRCAPLPEVDARLVPWLRRFHARIPTVVSICTGAFVLAAAGVLDGRRATTHWMFLDELRARYPAAQVVDEGIFVKDRGVWTSAGITTGIDLDARDGRGGPRPRRRDGGRQAAGAVPAPFGEPGSVQRGAAAAGGGAAEAARHLHVRPRAPRRAAARSSVSRGGVAHEPALAEPLVPGAPRRIARRRWCAACGSTRPAGCSSRPRFRSRTSRRGPASATPARCGVCSPAASASRPPRIASASPRRPNPLRDARLNRAPPDF